MSEDAVNQKPGTRAITPPLKPFKSPYRTEIDKKLKLSALRFLLPGGQSFDVAARSYIVIGRQDGNEREVHLDLAPYGARDSGVSRTHVVVQVTTYAVFVRDFNSRNGTFLNGIELYPMRDYGLQSGDELTLGHFTMRIKFIP